MKKVFTSIALSAGVLMGGTTAALAQESSVGAYENQGITVYKDPNCGCCAKWAEQMEESGFDVTTVNTSKMNEIKAGLGVSADSSSCHTAMVGDYFVEGHVPAAVLKSMLQAKPNIRGVSAPGMPVGSPGMEMPGMTGQPYEIQAIDLEGNVSVLTTVQP